MKKLLVLIAFALPGCLKAPEVTYDFGPQASSKDVDVALSKLTGASALTVAKGEFVYLETSVRIESQRPEVIRQQAHTVVDRKENDTSITLNIVKRLVEINGTQTKPSASEYEVVIKKTSPVSPKTEMLQMPNQVFTTSLANLFSTQVVKQDRRVNYHNLKVENLITPVPLLVQMRENCGGLGAEKCSQGIPSVRVNLDLVIWDGSTPNKTSYSWLSSANVPALAAQLSSCAQSVMPYQGSMYNIVQCEEAKDFTK